MEEDKRADLKTELKWIFYNKKFMSILIVLVFFTFLFAFNLGVTFTLKKASNIALELASSEEMEGIVKWGCSALQGELIKYS